MKISRFIFFLLFVPLTCSSQDVDTIEAELKDSYDGFSGGCSLGCAIGWKMSASSHLEDGDQNDYRIKNLEDRNKSTAWAEGAEDHGIGERIIIEFQDNLDSSAVPFYEIGVRNGYCKDQKTWKDHARVKTALLKKNGSSRMILEFKDSKHPQVFKWDVDQLHVRNGDTISIEIRKVYKGEEHDHTTLSDMHLMGAH